MTEYTIYYWAGGKGSSIKEENITARSIVEAVGIFLMSHRSLTYDDIVEHLEV